MFIFSEKHINEQKDGLIYLFCLFQPTELLKFTLILFLAYFFKKNIKKIKTFKEGFLPFL